MRPIVDSFHIEVDGDGIVRLDLTDRGAEMASVAMSQQTAERLVCVLREALGTVEEILLDEEPA